MDLRRFDFGVVPDDDRFRFFFLGLDSGGPISLASEDGGTITIPALSSPSFCGVLSASEALSYSD